MSAQLHKFRDDLKKRPPRGSSAPPVGIRARDLDENFKKVTLIDSDKSNPKPYEVAYTKDGIRLENIRQIPDGTNDGDLAFWKASDRKWLVFPAVQDRTKLHVLGILDGKLGWIATEDC